MKYFSGMLTKLMETNSFVDPQDRMQMKAQFDESFDKSAKSKNPVVRGINDFLSHPFGVMLSILLYVFVAKQVRKANQESNALTMKEEFELAYKKEIMDGMIRDVQENAA